MFEGPTRVGRPQSTASTLIQIAFAASPRPPRVSVRPLLFAELCNVKWKPQPRAHGLRLAAELDPGNRIGPEKLWAKFDKALDHLGVALEGRRLHAARRRVRFAIGRGEPDRRRSRARRSDQPDWLSLASTPPGQRLRALHASRFGDRRDTGALNLGGLGQPPRSRHPRPRSSRDRSCGVDTSSPR